MTPALAAVLLARVAGVPSALLPSVAARARRALAAVAACPPRRALWKRPTHAAVAEAVAECAVRDWRAGVLERCCTEPAR